MLENVPESEFFFTCLSVARLYSKIGRFLLGLVLLMPKSKYLSTFPLLARLIHEDDDYHCNCKTLFFHRYLLRGKLSNTSSKLCYYIINFVCIFALIACVSNECHTMFIVEIFQLFHDIFCCPLFFDSLYIGVRIKSIRRKSDIGIEDRDKS